LFGDTQYFEEFSDRYPGITRDEMDNPMMSSAKSVLCKYRIGVSREIAIRIKEEFYSLNEFFITQEKGIRSHLYVSHIDIYCLW